MSPTRDRTGPAADKLREAGIVEEDLDESFVRAGGKGGQNVNKVSTCVLLVHRPTGLAVKCQIARTQGENRTLARVLLAEKLLAVRAKAAAERKSAQEKRRRQKRTRPAGIKRAILADKRQASTKKQTRKRVDRDD